MMTPPKLEVFTTIEQPGECLGYKYYGCEHKPMPSPLISFFGLLSILYSITRSAVLWHQYWTL